LTKTCDQNDDTLSQRPPHDTLVQGLSNEAAHGFADHVLHLEVHHCGHEEVDVVAESFEWSLDNWRSVQARLFGEGRLVERADVEGYALCGEFREFIAEIKTKCIDE
jgi:hypothetical protein